MNTETLKMLLTNAGLEKVRVESDFIYFQDPSCIFPAFDKFFTYAWHAILVMTAILLFGWAVLYIKNAPRAITMFRNARSLVLMLCILGAVKPIINIVYGSDLFAKQCETKSASMATVNELLNMRNKKFGKSDQHMLYETFNVTDSGPTGYEDE